MLHQVLGRSNEFSKLTMAMQIIHIEPLCTWNMNNWMKNTVYENIYIYNAGWHMKLGGVKSAKVLR